MRDGGLEIAAEHAATIRRSSRGRHFYFREHRQRRGDPEGRAFNSRETSMTLYKWSQIASADATADGTVNWAEGQARHRSTIPPAP
jgi:hypothetical protein